MRRMLMMVLVGSLFVVLFPSIAGCAKGGNGPSRHRPDSGSVSGWMPDAGVRAVGTDAGSPLTSSADAGRAPLDAFMPSRDALVMHEPMPESCNGADDDRDGFVDEIFLCPLGRMGEICVTSCGANGYRLCEAPSCSWSSTCHTFDELCGDAIDNDCDGIIDEGCVSNPTTSWDCHEDMLRIRITPDPSRLGSCSSGWTLVLWGSGGAFEEYRSSPGNPLEVLIRDDWLGWSAVTAYCGDWSHVRDWSGFEGGLSELVGISVTIDGESVPVQVCHDPGGDLIRPLIPVQCGLPACPGRSY